MVIGSHKRMIVYKKTDFRCAKCGSSANLTCTCFIPEWTRIVGDNTDNIIPLCDKCRLKKGMNFMELGELVYLPKLYIDLLMRYYMTIDKYLHKYVREFGKYRTNGRVDVTYALQVLSSYDGYIKDNDIHWENL